MSNPNSKTNAQLVDVINQLKAQSRETGSAVWRDVAIRLSRSRKNWAQPNLSRVSRHAPEGATILVPGKLLGSGEVSSNHTVAAYSVSNGAREKIEAAGGRVMTYGELMNENPSGKGLLSLAEKTFVFDAEGMILGRLASATADLLLKAAREDRDDKVIIVNAEKAIVSGSKTSVFNKYQEKYKLNHARKGPFFPRMPDMILKRAVRGMLPYQSKSSGRRALRNLRVEIGCPSHLDGDLPDGHEHGDDSKIRKGVPERFVSLGDISQNLGAPSHRWNGGEQ